MFFELVCGGAADPGNSKRDKRHEQAELARIGQGSALNVKPRVLASLKRLSIAHFLRYVRSAFCALTLVATISHSS